MLDALAPWAPDADDRRTPTTEELAGGFDCGSADKALFNELFFRTLGSQTELTHLVEGAGLTVNPSDMYQVLSAVIRMHRITEDTTLYVGSGSQFETIQEALDYLSTKFIPSTVSVTLDMAAGEHLVDSTTGSNLINHPYGHRIKIRGQPLTGPFPSFSDIDNASHTVVEATLRSRFPTVITVVGAVNALFMQGGALDGLERVLIVGDGTPNQHGFMAGEWINSYGWGNLIMSDVWFHRLGEDGLRMNYNSALVVNRIGCTHCGNNGIRVANVSNMTVNDTIISAYNGGRGVFVLDNSFFELKGTGLYVEQNGGVGFEAGSGTSVNLGGAGATVRLRNNTGAGLRAAGSGQIAIATDISALTMSSNGTDLSALAGGYIMSSSALLTGKSASPALNTVGNGQSYIYSF